MPRQLAALSAWAILALGVGGCRAGGPAPRAPAPPPDCCRQLEYVFEASIFKVDVMHLRVRVDAATAAAVRSLIGGGARTALLEEHVAGRYLAARTATIETRFLMAMSGETFVGNATKALRGLARDGQLTAPAADSLAAAARRRFEFLAAGGVRRDDRIEYALAGDTVTTRYLRADVALLHDRQVGPTHRAALLGSYFAPSSDFRRGLLDRAFGR